MVPVVIGGIHVTKADDGPEIATTDDGGSGSARVTIVLDLTGRDSRPNELIAVTVKKYVNLPSRPATVPDSPDTSTT